ASKFSLRNDTETPIRRIDVGGPDQEQRMAEFVYTSINNLSEGRTVQQAIRKLGLQSERDVLPGLEVRLLPHQLIGVSWMVDQEKISPHKGGILAYVISVSGKTVQMIATMATNLPKDLAPTLVVVPSALLFQWKEEIETKTNDLFTVHIHHGRDKLMTISDVKSKDIIITTYQTLCAELSVPSDVDEGEELDWLENNGGVLSRLKWYRVILDEAHFIRNRGTLASRSVALLRAHYRWMLTGTPVTNTLADIYGLIRFGRFRPWNDWKDFNQYIAKQQRQDPPLAAMRAQEILKPLLLRRTKNAKLDGKPILQLPLKHIDLVTLEFSVDEREIYDNFEKRSRIRINRYIKDRTLLKKYVAVMMLRLRQLCCHPNLILSQAGDYDDPTLIMSDDKEKERGRAVKLMGPAWVNNVCLVLLFLKRALANDMFMFSDELDDDDNTCPQCKDLYMKNAGRVLACGHELCFDCLLDISNAPIMHNGEFGLGTETENIRAEREYEVASAKGYRPCPVCKKMCDLTPQKIFQSSAFEPDREELQEAVRGAKHARRSGPSKPEPRKRAVSVDSDEEDDTVPPVKTRFRGGTPLSDSSDEELPDFSQLIASKGNFKKKKLMSDNELDLDDSDEGLSVSGGKGKGKAVNSNDNEPSAPSGAVLAMWRKGDYDLEPSVKMLALVEQLREADEHGDKTICFSQWTSMLDLVEILLSRYGIRSVRYDGKMDRAARDKALVIFKRYDGPKVILISTRCGGVGLNLVAANRIVNLDLSWNYAAETQAYDRVHRLGQEKEVFVKRLIVKDTIEERMLRLQEVKIDLADAALGEGNGVKLNKMSVKEIQAVSISLAPFLRVDLILSNSYLA
ncbi:SNF2 family N-terminal domain-containing protein, partial [Scleroderma citrinum]